LKDYGHEFDSCHEIVFGGDRSLAVAGIDLCCVALESKHPYGCNPTKEAKIAEAVQLLGRIVHATFILPYH
jgi:hypothetical protein